MRRPSNNQKRNVVVRKRNVARRTAGTAPRRIIQGTKKRRLIGGDNVEHKGHPAGHLKPSERLEQRNMTPVQLGMDIFRRHHGNEAFQADVEAWLEKHPKARLGNPNDARRFLQDVNIGGMKRAVGKLGTGRIPTKESDRKSGDEFDWEPGNRRDRRK